MINIKKEHIRIKQKKRTGICILFVVDSSGSMGVKKWKLLRELLCLC